MVSRSDFVLQIALEWWSRVFAIGTVLSPNIKYVLPDHLTKTFLLEITVLRRILKLYFVIMMDYHCLPWTREEGNGLIP